MITGQFETIDGKKCDVTINCASTIKINETKGYYFADNPVVIEVDNSDTFNHIIKTTCKIRLLVKQYIPELFTADDLAVPVTVKVNNVCVFSGYVKPFCYNQPYANSLTELTLECQDYLCSLENHKYANGTITKTNTSSVSFRSILNDSFTGKTIVYDNSITVDNGKNVFDNIYVNNKIFVGEEKDDLKTKEEVIEIILKFLNLHIVQIGDKFYIFNYNNKRKGINGKKDITVDKQYYLSDDTQLSISDVYNQFIINCDLEEEENIIPDALDTEALTSPFTNFNKYCREWEKGDDKKHDWFIQYYDNLDWVYKYVTNNTASNVSSLVEYVSGKAVSQTEIPKALIDNPLTPMILSLGKNDAKDQTDNSPEEKPTNFEDYIVISVNGTRESANTTTTLNTWNNVINKTSGIIKYTGSSVGSLTPTDDSVTNYIVISGNLFLQPAFTYPYKVTLTGVKVEWDEESYGTFERHVEKYLTQEEYYEEYDNLPMGWGSYQETWGVSWEVVKNPDGICCSWFYGKGKKPLEIGELKTSLDEYGKYNNLIPPLDYDEWKNKFKEYYGDWFYYKNQDNTDYISKVPILVCQLRIGNKYCIETTENNFKWVTTRKVTYDEAIGSEVFEVGDDVYEDENGGIYFPTFAIGIDPKIGDFLLATEFDISSTMDYQNTKGTYIPIKSTDGLSGEIEFKILSPSYTGWEQNIRQHPTLFRSTKWWTRKLPLMEYVRNIFIKEFRITTETDNGNVNNLKYKDLVYMSSINEASVKEASDITFEICTGLSKQEADNKGINNQPKVNNIFDADGNVITKLERSDIPNYTKAEEFYITDYYNEYKDPKIILETSLDTNKTGYWDLYTFSYFDGKVFYPINYSYDVKLHKTKYTLKEK